MPEFAVRTQSYNVQCNLCAAQLKIQSEHRTRQNGTTEFSLDLSEFKFHMATEHRVEYRRDHDQHPQPVR